MKAIGWILLAVGGYVLYEYFYGKPTTPTSGAATATSGANTVQSGVPANTGTSVQAQTQIGQTIGTQARPLVQSAGTDSANYDTWAYYYNQTNTPLTSSQMDRIIALGGGDRNASISSSTFLALVAQVGAPIGNVMA